MEALAWFALGAGCALVIDVGCGLLYHLIKARRQKIFENYVANLRKTADEIVEKAAEDQKGPKEVSELTFRDKQGQINVVKIVIDPDLEDHLPANQEELDELMKTGNAGTLEDLMNNHKVTEEQGRQVQEFVFTPSAVRRMRLSGIEPDEVVVRMLRQTGRMA